MNVKLSFALVASVALFVSSCSSPQSLILGKWEVENAPLKMTAEFSADGTARMTMFGQTLQGKYKLDDGNELEWTMNGTTTKSKSKRDRNRDGTDGRCESNDQVPEKVNQAANFVRTV